MAEREGLEPRTNGTTTMGADAAMSVHRRGGERVTNGQLWGCLRTDVCPPGVRVALRGHRR